LGFFIFVKSFWFPLLPLRFLWPYIFWVSISVVGVRGDSTRGLEMAVAAGTRIGFIGAGQMAEAIAKGLNSAGVVRCDQMIAADVNLGRCKVFQSLGIAICGSNTEVAEASDVLILAVKPQIGIYPLHYVLCGIYPFHYVLLFMFEF
jgi:hypothetical protein